MTCTNTLEMMSPCMSGKLIACSAYCTAILNSLAMSFASATRGTSLDILSRTISRWRAWFSSLRFSSITACLCSSSLRFISAFMRFWAASSCFIRSAAAAFSAPAMACIFFISSSILRRSASAFSLSAFIFSSRSRIFRSNSALARASASRFAFICASSSSLNISSLTESKSCSSINFSICSADKLDFSASGFRNRNRFFFPITTRSNGLRVTDCPPLSLFPLTIVSSFPDSAFTATSDPLLVKTAC
mmetsp:Transcript_34199/g.55444  ORF Transcript_34199/g.55444 Transcript_34199/m.55444 type:complete len:247 (-) Transcript_34199:469-1209(-)